MPPRSRRTDRDEVDASRRARAKAVLVLLAVVAVALLALPPPVHATPTPSVVAPQIISSALPYVFANRTFAYTLVANTPANWTCISCYSSVLASGSPSINAALHGTLPYNDTAQHFSVRACVGAACTYQNWTSNVTTTPVITSTPSFYETPGVNYTYIPTTLNGILPCSWTFTGAPYFHFIHSNGEIWTSNPTNVLYQNTLTYTCFNGNWVQSWWTSPYNQVVPSTITVSALTLTHQLNVTVPTTDVAGIGTGLVWVGQYPLVKFPTTYYQNNYTFSFDGGWNYTLVWSAGPATQETVWAYAPSGIAPLVLINVQPYSVGAIPTAGFKGFATTPLAAPTGLVAKYITSTAFTLTYTNPPGASNDTFLVGTVCGDWATSSSPGVPVASHVFSNLLAGVTYCVGVSAWNGISPSTVATLSVTTAAGAPPPVVLIAGAVTTSTITVTWTNPPGYPIKNATVWYGVGTCTALKAVDTGSNVTAWTILGLPSNVKFCIEVQVWSPGGTASIYSNQVYDTTAKPTVLPPPTLSGAGSIFTSANIEFVLGIVLAAIGAGIVSTAKKRSTGAFGIFLLLVGVGVFLYAIVVPH